MTSTDPVKILLVDDRHGNLVALSAILAELGQTLVRANSAEEALKAVLEADFAAILLDVKMPGMSGFEAAKLIRARPRSRHTPIIFLSASPSDEFPIEEAYNLGAVDYLLKPIIPVILRAKVAVFVELYRRTRELQEVERQQADAAIREQKQLWRTTLASIGDAVIATDIEGRVSFLNPVAEKLTGWTSSEAHNRPLSEVFHIVNETTREEVENPALRALSEGVIVGLANHTVLVSKDGAERPIDDSAAPIRTASGQIGGAVLVFRDITERRLAEEARVRLAAIVQSSDDAIISKTLDGTIRSWNLGAQRIFGYTAEEAIGKPITLIIPPDREHEEVAILARLRRGERIDHYETVRRAKDGRLVDISVTISPMRDESGRIIGAAKIARDITAQKRAAEEVRASEERLREADRRKDEFLALLAHELRNPLAPLRNGLQIMRMATDEDTMARARDMMDRQLSHMVRLIDDLLDVSRISRNKIELRRQRVSIADVAKSAVETARPMIEGHGHELNVFLPREPIYLNADLTRLSQVFANLLNNAAKYTENGGHIQLSARVVGKVVEISVKDSGVGIPAEMLPHVFEMFTQIDRTLERSQGGLGIGLTIAKRLVELHEGTIEAHSKGRGQGSEFIVRLPIDPAKEAARPTDIVRPRAKPKKRRVLVVDDHADVAASLAMMLELGGHEVRAVNDAEAALETGRAFLPEIVLLDIGMPRINGYEAAGRIRKEPWGTNVDLIALTGWGQERDKLRAKNAGFDDHLIKPIDPEALERILERS